MCLIDLTWVCKMKFYIYVEIYTKLMSLCQVFSKETNVVY